MHLHCTRPHLKLPLAPSCQPAPLHTTQFSHPRPSLAAFNEACVFFCHSAHSACRHSCHPHASLYPISSQRQDPTNQLAPALFSCNVFLCPFCTTPGRRTPRLPGLHLLQHRAPQADQCSQSPLHLSPRFASVCTTTICNIAKRTVQAQAQAGIPCSKSGRLS